jgi:integrase
MTLRKIKRGSRDNIYDYKDGTHWVQVSRNIGGKNHTRQKYGLNTLGDARRARDELDNELFELALTKQSGMPTWAVALDEYMNHCEKTQAASTYYSKSKILLANTKVWNEELIDKIEPDTIEKLVTDVCSKKSVDSKINLLKYIRGVFQHQVVLGKLVTNPCQRIPAIKKPDRQKLTAMTRLEIETLLKETKKMNHPWFPIYYVMYQLGLRSGEGFALTWDDVDLNTKRVTISKSYCFKSKKIKVPKNGKSRTLVMNQSLVEFLKSLRQTNPTSSHVLPQLTDWKRGEAARILRALQKDFGIRSTNFHSIRASFITHLLLKNVPITKVQELVGHRDLETTQEYVRLIASDLEGSTDSISVSLD